MSTINGVTAHEQFEDGHAILADSTSELVMLGALQLVSEATLPDRVEPVPLIIADPPYGNIVDEKWDRVNDSDELFSDWMIRWTRGWTQYCLAPGGAFYVWGGVGRPGFRPFLRYLSEVEQPGQFELANLITWSKKRAYGVQNNYLWTREECAYFIRGDAKRPRCFNVPLLETKRGYAGYNAKYPAKSEFYRRTNVWTDINEIFRGKLHPTQKQQRLHEVMVEVHTQPGEWVIDPFAGAGTTAFACRKLGRRFVVIENDRGYFDDMVRRLRVNDASGEVGSGHAGTDDAGADAGGT